jgi:hypothetical protein
MTSRSRRANDVCRTSVRTIRDGVFYDAAATGRIGAYLYSPAFAQLLAASVPLWQLGRETPADRVAHGARLFA